MNDEKKFIYLFWLGVGSLVGGLTLLTAIIFKSIPKENQQMANVALGFILNNLITTVLLYYFGGNPSKKNNESTVTTNSDNTNITVTPPNQVTPKEDGTN